MAPVAKQRQRPNISNTSKSSNQAHLNNSAVNRDSAANFLPIHKSTPNGSKVDCSQNNITPKFVFSEDGNKFIPCEHCSLAFTYRSSLVKHLKTCKAKAKVEKSVQVIDTIEISDDEEDVSVHVQKKSKSVHKTTAATNNKKWQPVRPNNNTPRSRTVSKKTVPLPSKQIRQQSTNHFRYVPMFNQNLTDETSQVPESSVVHDVIEFKHECVYCGELFQNLMELLSHCNAEHCDFANKMRKKILLNDDDVEELEVIVRDSSSHHCPACNMDIKNYKNHIQLHYYNMRHRCHCGKTFNRKDYLIIHMRSHEK